MKTMGFGPNQADQPPYPDITELLDSLVCNLVVLDRPKHDVSDVSLDLGQVSVEGHPFFHPPETAGIILPYYHVPEETQNPLHQPRV